MKCADRYKPKHFTRYIECEKLAGHDAPHAAYANGQQVTWRDHDKGRRGAPDLVSIERESLAALLAYANGERTTILDEAVVEAQRVLGHTLANGTPLRTAEQIIEERVARAEMQSHGSDPLAVLRERQKRTRAQSPSTLETPRTKHEPKALEREPTVNVTDRDETQSGAATTADVEREKREAEKEAR